MKGIRFLCFIVLLFLSRQTIFAFCFGTDLHDGIYYYFDGEVFAYYHELEQWNVPVDRKYAGEIPDMDFYYKGNIIVPDTIFNELWTGLTCGNSGYISRAVVSGVNSNAFSECKELISITLPQTIQYIEYHAFYNCTNLQSVTIKAITPPTVSTDAFYGVSKTIPLYVPSESVDDYRTADKWNDFTNIRPIPCLIASGACGENLTWELSCDSVLTISGTGAMTDFDSSNEAPWKPYDLAIKVFVVNRGVTSVGNRAFYGCGANLTSIEIPNTVTSIGQCAFYNCSNLTSISIPTSVKTIKDSAFRYCRGLTSVYIPNSVSKIGASVFEYCDNLITAYISSSVSSIGRSAFSGCKNLLSIEVDEANSTYSSIDGVLFNKDQTTLIQYPLGKSESQYIIPNTVSTIGSWAFSYVNTEFNTKLTSVVIPNSVTTIENSVFWNSKNLTSLYNYATSPQAIDANVFQSVDLSALTLYVPAKSIEAYKEAEVWKDITNIQAIKCLLASGTCGEDLTWELSCDSVLTISGTGAMTDWYASVSVPWSDYHDNIAYLLLPEGLTSIGSDAFCLCKSLKSVTIPSTVTNIGDGAFDQCSGLTSIIIPNSVISIGNGAFYECTGLTSPIYTTKVFAFLPYKYSGSYSIPDGIESIAGGAFLSRKSLTSIVIPNTVTSIGREAFLGCKVMSSVTIPNNVISIGDYAFTNCNILTSITNYAIIPQKINENVFALDKSAITLYVPAESLEAYQAADVWKDFGTIKAIDETPAPCVPVSGECGAQGNNLSWELSCDSVLTISGKGDMADYTNSASAPWYEYRLAINILTIEDDVTSIGNYAFTKCSGLTSIVIGDSITRVGDRAFQGCENIKEVSIGKNVAALGNGVFHNCPVIEKVQWNAVNYRQVKPNSGDDNCFPFYSSRESITSFVFGDEVEYIPAYLMKDFAYIGQLSIPASVTEIGEFAFANDYNVGEITCWATTPPTVANTTFLNMNTSKCVLYVPYSYISLYKEADGWKDFTNILPIEEQEEPSVLPTHAINLDLTQSTSIMEWTITDATLNEEASDETSGKYAYDIKMEIPGIVYVTTEPNVRFITQNNTTDKPKAFYIQTGQYFMFSGKKGTIKIMNTSPGDKILLTVASKGSASASFLDEEGGGYQIGAVPVTALADLTLPAKDKTSAEADENGYIWREIEFVSTGGDVEIKETAAGFCIKRIVVEHYNQIGDLYYGLDYENNYAVVIENPKAKYSGDIVIPDSISVNGKQYNVQLIDYFAFADCTELTSITCESSTPPYCQHNSFQGVDSMLPIYVHKESIETYRNAWSRFKNINPLEAEEVTIVEPTAEPTSNSVVIEWPKDDRADTYTIVIKKGDEIVCSLIFDAQGQLLTIAFAAPSRNGKGRQTPAALQTSTGWQYSISGLDAGTDYTYIVTAKKSDNSVVYEESVPFKTQDSATGIEVVEQESDVYGLKMIKNGQLIILRGDRTYTLTGQEVR